PLAAASVARARRTRPAAAGDLPRPRSPGRPRTPTKKAPTKWNLCTSSLFAPSLFDLLRAMRLRRAHPTWTKPGAPWLIESTCWAVHKPAAGRERGRGQALRYLPNLA